MIWGTWNGCFSVCLLGFICHFHHEFGVLQYVCCKVNIRTVEGPLDGKQLETVGCVSLDYIVVFCTQNSNLGGK